MYEWQLDDLYPSFESEAFQNDLASVDTLLEAFQHIQFDDNLENIKAVIALKEKQYVLFRKLSSYISLNLATKTTDTQSTNYQNVMANKFNQFAKINAQIDRFLGEIDTDITQDEDLAEYTFYFAELKEEAKHLLSDEAEEVITKLNRSAGSGWSNLTEYLTSTVETDFRGETKTLSQLRNLAYSADSDVRKEAFEVEIKLYDGIKDSIAFSLNNIKSQVLDVTQMRGYDSPLDETLKKSRMSRETLDALLSAIKNNLPIFRKYLNHKASLLGHDNGLPFYDLFAPMGKTSQTFTVEESKAYLVEKFQAFAPDLAEMTTQFYDKHYMDFYPRKGKRGGAFCSNLPFIKQSRIMLNFGESLSDILTIAHELGHAYHGTKIHSHRPLNWRYSMPVAETASTFNEAIVMNYLIKEAKSDDEKVAVIEQYLQDVTQIIVDIYSRYLFESEVFEKRQNSFMFADELADMMTKAQIEAYGDGLDKDALHPYMWVNKTHYYSTGLSFYNFPYAYGGLFSRGLYEIYQNQPDGFVEKYGELLHKTTVASVEDVAKVMDIDVTSEAFWQSTMNGIADYVDQFIALTTK
ncbi:M3 family oligoendopeptidase [Fundicoccus culcitae]|uniref:M3 family oligoendopeptidase n=1 Tax=Fundicoccus culcitae TaxID=2969821 RepID=A0ABY5P6E6_9LACT|nr:M3 family oligoendopeptidase [Fundicoccus culcitae]UUX34055.1 M3 family oligoendopeptidase [Fundicoccus culcitae]